MRLFIAIPLPGNVRRALFAARGALENAGARGRFTPMENYHITLKFIGESEALSELASGMRQAVSGMRPMPLTLLGYERFSGGKGGHTGVALIGDPAGELKRLYELLDGALSELGFPRGRSKFIPHVTLGRNISGDEKGVIIRQEAFTAASLTLFESRSGKYGMEYLPLHKEVF